jgi:hypothetical protein
MSRVLWAGVVLAADVAACEGLLRGLPVPRRRLHGGVLVALDEPLSGPPVVLTDELALRLDVALITGWWSAGRSAP